MFRIRTKRLLKYLFYTFGMIVLLIGAAIGAIVAWVYYEPRDLTAYKSHIERAINSTFKDGKVTLGSARLKFGGISEPLAIDAKNIFVHDTKQREIVKIDDIEFSYNLRELLFGNYVPSTLVVTGARVDGSDFFSKDDESDFNIRDLNLSTLKKLELKNGVLALPNIGEEWQVEYITLLFSGDKTNISGKVIPGEGELLELGGKGYPKNANFDVTAKLSNVGLSRFRHFAPELNGVDIKANGNVVASFRDGKITTTGIEINSANGSITHEKLRDVIKYNNLSVTAAYDFNKEVFALAKSSFEFNDGFKLSASGAYTKEGDINITANMADLSIDNIKTYWPKDVGDNAISWMQAHLKGGNIPTGNAKVNIQGSDYEKGTIPSNAVALDFDVIGTDVVYADNLLPVKAASGKAFMDADSLNIKISEGRLGTSRISNTVVNITEIGKKQEWLKVEGDITGSAKDIADFYVKVNKSRGKELLFDSTNDIAGNAVTHLVVKLPLIAALKFEEVSVALNSKIAGGIINSSAKSFAAKNANIIIDLNDAGYSVKGTVLAGYNGSNDLINFSNVPMKFVYEESPNRTGAGIDADITESEIIIKQLGAKKPKGEEGKLELLISGTKLGKLNIDSKSLKFSASGEVNKKLDDINSLNISNFESEGNKFSANIINSDGYIIDMIAEKLDARHIIDDAGENKDPLAEEKDAGRVRISAKINKLGMHQNQILNDVKIKADCGSNCTTLELESKDLQISKTAEKLLIKSPNAGKVLKMLDAYDNIEGGVLVVEAKVIGKDAYEGIVTIVDFQLVKAQVLAKILTLGSLTGIADTMQGNGIGFKKLKTKFKWDEKELKVADFRMFGAAIGATTDGTLDRKTDKLDFGGKIIPAYTANTLLGKIPILGDIIIGDTGVFAFAYSVKGTAEDPEVFVNPLSVLAPGFLQDIFQ